MNHAHDQLNYATLHRPIPNKLNNFPILNRVRIDCPLVVPNEIPNAQYTILRCQGHLYPRFHTIIAANQSLMAYLHVG